MKQKVSVFLNGKEIEFEVNTVTREQRKKYHWKNQMVVRNSEFKMVDGEAETSRIVIDWELRGELYLEILNHAFGGAEECKKILDDEGYDDNQQDLIADAILREWSNLSKKADGD